jgi:integrase/recombinase XerD
MNRPSSFDSRTVDHFLQDQQFRDSETYRIYGCLLRSFQQFVCKHSTGPLLSVSILEQWLKKRREEWPLRMVYLRARLVERFLEWSQARGSIAANPFAELHRRYGSRTAPIVRALLSADVDAALRELRPLPRFGSFLGKHMEEHVRHMRSLGYRYDVNEDILLRFDRFLQGHAELIDAPLDRLVEIWSECHPSPNRLFEAQKAGHLISKAMHRFDLGTPILPLVGDVRRRACQQQRRPYLYTDEEIQRLLRAALSFPSPKAPLRPLCLHTMLMLAYCAGLRLGEIVNLTLADVDLKEGAIEIRDTKFFKNRRLPLASEVMALLKRYLTARHQAGAPVGPESRLFWNKRRGRGYSKGAVEILLVQVLRRAGLKPSSGRTGPRIHDIRHTMVGHRMRDWYREGINPQSRLPYLATYLGHKDIKSTLVYLSVMPEPLQEASERFRKNSAQVICNSGGSL